MTVTATEIVSEETTDIILTVKKITTKDNSVAYYATCEDADGARVMVTVFENNLPDIKLKEGKRYRFSSVKGERWEDGTPGICIGPKTIVEEVLDKASHRSSTRVVGNEIEEDSWIDIALKIQNIKSADDPIAYHAWSTDELGETVVITVFEDNLPPFDLQENEWYEFTQVCGERWNDGTPGIKLHSESVVKKRAEEPETKDSSNSGGLVIDAVANDDLSRGQRSLSRSIPSSVGLMLSTSATAIAIGASLLAPELGLLGITGFLVVGTGAAGATAYYTHYNPSNKLRQQREEVHVRLFLELLAEDYYRLVETDVDVRANVMKIEGSKFRKNGRTLSIFSHTGEYKDSELDLRYNPSKKQGTCGSAFSLNEITVYDSKDNPLSGGNLNPVQKDVNGNIKSILSIPIYADLNTAKHTIGVLNIDSKESIEETKFDSTEVQQLAVRYADIIGDVLQ